MSNNVTYVFEIELIDCYILDENITYHSNGVGSNHSSRS